MNSKSYSERVEGISPVKLQQPVIQHGAQSNGPAEK